MGQIRLALPISFFRKILYIICVFLLPVFSPVENVFYAETISDIAGGSITVIAFFTLILPRLRQKLDFHLIPANAQKVKDIPQNQDS